ncbi:protein kinase domain-containing protein [Intestinibacter sp.]|uniref:protein kinase domain-containing protein n=1 Tax=Intestinibacter sp. TaxID=1965304 RepID=UPI003F16F00B
MLVIDDRYEILGCEDESLKIDNLYKAKDLQLDSYVYIKILKNNRNIDDDFIPDLIDESTMILSIDSRHIAKILDIGDYKSGYYIVSEYFEGITLYDFINNSNLRIKDILFIGKQIVGAMKNCDEKKIYHGGLRLDNILLDDGLNIKIYDLGITKANGGVNIRMNDNISFLCPHQLNINYTDRESDFFSIGIILYYCVFKEMPFKIGKTDLQMLKNIDKGIDLDQDKITVLNEGIVRIIKKLLDRKDKYQSYNEILIDLTELMYVKADIAKNNDIDLNQDINYKKSKKNNSFMIKFISIIMCIIILIMIIL